MVITFNDTIKISAIVIIIETNSLTCWTKYSHRQNGPIDCWFQASKLVTRVSAFCEILHSLQCKIVQYTFLGQYPIKLKDFFSQSKIPHPAWLQLDHKKLGLPWMRLFRPLYYKTEKTLFQMWYAALLWKTLIIIYWVFNLSRYIWQ